MERENHHEVEEKEEEEPDWVLARRGIKMLINNEGVEAQYYFLRHSNSLVMFAGYSFAIFMDALMTFEDDKINLAISTLREVERRCLDVNSNTNWFKTVKNKMFGSSSDIRSSPTLVEIWETQIILADSQVCLAILTFLQQDMSGYFKGGWVLRKSWKIYQSVYNEISRMYKEVFGELPIENASPMVSTSSSPLIESERPSLHAQLSNGYLIKKSNSSDNTTLNNCASTVKIKKSQSMNNSICKHTQNNNNRHFWNASTISIPYLTSVNFNNLFNHQIPPLINKSEGIDQDSLKRLMSAVCFGYGLFQLGISLLPQSLLKFTNFLGFGGNRSYGIACLMYAKEGVDMRAPLATLSLLWYHTIVRPFYALDGSNVQAGVTASDQILLESVEYENSSLFLFFKGRVNRLKSNIPEALKSYQLSVDNANQREIKILSLHEVGWCHLIQLDYCQAEGTFVYLKSWSRWSKAFYSYLSGICAGSCRNLPGSVQEDIDSCPKGGQLDEFLKKRAKFTNVENVDAIYWRLLVYEMLYLWNALPSCSVANIEKIIADCASIDNCSIDQEAMLGLSKLIQGCCCCIVGRSQMGVACFRAGLDMRRSLPPNAEDAHISAFIQYELGNLLIRKPETKDEGKLLLQQICHYRHYDFEQRLNFRVHAILKHV